MRKRSSREPKRKPARRMARELYKEAKFQIDPHTGKPFLGTRPPFWLEPDPQKLKALKSNWRDIVKAHKGIPFRADRSRSYRQMEALREVFRRAKKERLTPEKKRRALAQIAAYEKEVHYLRPRIPSILLSNNNIQLARSKLEGIKGAEWVAARVDKVSRILGELTKDIPLHHEEGFRLSEPYKWINEHKTWAVDNQLTPSITAARQMNFASNIAQWDLIDYSYNAIVFFNPELFQSYGKMGPFHWGRISSPEEVPKEKRVLGVMIFDPNPQTILKIAKTMAKRRSKDPLVLFDLYGNVFYP